MNILIGIITVIVSLAGIVLTLLTLPGTWLMLLVALLCQWWRPEQFSWWTLGFALLLAVIAEIIEFFASAVGATKAGGTTRGAVGATIGGLVGAIVGTPLIPIPIVGTIVGAGIGAGLGALLMERHGGQTWGKSARVAQGAAIGRLFATVAKTACAVAMAVMLIIDAFV